MQHPTGPCIGVDLGGTKIAVARVEPDGTLSRRCRIDTRVADGPKVIIQRMCKEIQHVMGDERVAGIGVAAPGPLNARTGVILSPPNLPGWVDIPLREELEKVFGLPVWIENDANAAAWGEYMRGAGSGADPMLYMTISTGIGGGVVLDGRLFRGADTYAGEIGHTTVDPSGPVCGCGRKGCLEVMASGTALARAAREAAERGNSLLSQWAEQTGISLTAEHVFSALDKGDEAAAAIVERTVEYLAIGISNFVHLFNPRRVVIGGGVTRSGEWLFNPLRERLEKWLMSSFSGTFDLRQAELGDDAGVLGAASLWAEKRGTFETTS
jgi:glucokinase